jgi:hypothetical protein
MFTPMSTYPDANDCVNFAKRDMVATQRWACYANGPQGSRGDKVADAVGRTFARPIGTLIPSCMPKRMRPVQPFGAAPARNGTRAERDGAAGKASTRFGAVAQQNFAKTAFAG